MVGMPYDDLKDAISRVYPTLSKQLQLIARFALDKPNELALGTVAAVADNGFIGKNIGNSMLNTWTWALRVSVPVFEGGRREAREHRSGQARTR
jgi:hypothetical protein